MLPFASGPRGATLSDSAGRQPSEIPSKTRSVSAFLPGRVSMGPHSSGQFRSQQHGSVAAFFVNCYASPAIMFGANQRSIPVV